MDLPTSEPTEKTANIVLYQALLESWNRREAEDFAALFGAGGAVIGFDGSLMHGHVVGMHPPEQTELHPAVNAIQSLTAVKRNGPWRIAFFQNTPAEFHGRPHLSHALTEELRQVLSKIQPN